jgi:beta-lactamase regulating signal transducer with metallopeptidase domain
MNFAASILPENVVNALGWTLLHSLWQGALAALGFALFLYLSRRASARARYAMGLAVLALVLLASAATFWNLFAAPAGPAAPVLAAAASPAPAAGPPAAAAPLGRRLTAFFGNYFSRHLPLIVTLWLLGVLFLSLRLAGGMLYAQRLKYSRSRPLPPPWPERLQALAAKAGLRRPLRLLESLRLRTPVVIGHLKPFLLLPAGLVTGLSAAEVEALLAHEVAHVMRRDYLVNVLQNLLEILYFFHPGVRWISSCVRQEREHCCDDIAVELCGDASGYARALASLQTDGAVLATPAMAAAGGSLLRRVTRLLARPRLVHDFREGFLSALLLVAGLLGMLKLAGAANGGVPMKGRADDGVPVAAPAAVAKPAAVAQPEPATPGKRFSLLPFALDADGKVKVSGQVPAGLNNASGTWIVDESDGQVVWYMALASKPQGGGETPFADEVSLKRGTYSWYLPAGLAGRAELTGARILPGRSADREEHLLQAEREKLLRDDGMRDEFLRQEDERLAREDARLKLEQEKQLKQEQARQEENLARMREEQRKLEAEQLALAETEKQLSREEQAKAQQELEELQKKEQELAAEMMKLKEREKREFERQLQAQKKAEEELRAAERKLRAEEERLRREEANLKKFIERLAADGVIDPAGSYEVRLSASAMTVNGKALPPEAQRKYRQFYETLTGRKLDKDQPMTIVHEK